MRRAIHFCTVAILAGLASALVLPAPPVSQELAFNHAKHERLTCAGCHAGIEKTARAGFPEPAVCAKCHASAPAAIEAADWEAFQATGVRFWKPVTMMPSHVMFSHRRHVALAGLACESCHGEVGLRTTPPVRMAFRLDMNTCLGCHRSEGASEDCAWCHR